MIHTDGRRTIANAPPRDRVLIDEDELRRRLDSARAEGYAEGYTAGWQAFKSLMDARRVGERLSALLGTP